MALALRFPHVGKNLAFFWRSVAPYGIYLTHMLFLEAANRLLPREALDPVTRTAALAAIRLLRRRSCCGHCRADTRDATRFRIADGAPALTIRWFQPESAVVFSAALNDIVCPTLEDA